MADSSFQSFNAWRLWHNDAGQVAGGVHTITYSAGVRNIRARAELPGARTPQLNHALDRRGISRMDQEIESEVIGHENRNRELVALIKGKGGDLARTRVLDLFFWAPSQESGSSLAKALVSWGMTELEVTPAADDRDKWSVEGKFQASVVQVTNPTITEELVRLAARFESKYDGWGTELTEL